MVVKLMYNEKTEEVRTTVASVTGKVFIGYIKAGFKPICDIRGGFITVSKFSQEDRNYFNTILNYDGQ